MSQLIIETFNPYAGRYQDRRVISREELHLYKLLRAQGVDVRVAGDPAYELNFLALKGIREWLSDPVVVLLLGIPVSVACSLLANALTALIPGRKPKATDVLIELDDKGSRAHYTCDGKPLDEAQFSTLVASMERRQLMHGHARQPASPYDARPVPLYLEHTDRIVGWGRLAVDDFGLRLDDALITDDETWKRVSDGSLRGLSIGALVREARCGICGESYFDCPHLSGETYNGVQCVAHLTNLDVGAVAIVEQPANPLARVRWRDDDSVNG